MDRRESQKIYRKFTYPLIQISKNFKISQNAEKAKREKIKPELSKTICWKFESNTINIHIKLQLKDLETDTFTIQICHPLFLNYWLNN